MLLLWSGGLDSTWMLCHALQSKKENEVIRTISLQQHQIGGNAGDHIARDAIKQHLLYQCWNFVAIECEWVYDSSDSNMLEPSSSSGLLQPPLWLLLGLAHAQQDEILQIGYVAGDDAIEYIPYLRWITDYYNTVTHKDVVLDLPLKNMQKYEVVECLQQFDAELLPLVWYCSSTFETVPCGKCTSCQRHAQVVGREK